MGRIKPPIVPEKPILVVTDQSVKTLFASCQGKDFVSQRDTAIIRVLFDPGARLSEMANLAVTDIDFDMRLLDVFGKGGRSLLTGRPPWVTETRATHRISTAPTRWSSSSTSSPLPDQHLCVGQPRAP
jgi:site-specific recombinase XerC